MAEARDCEVRDLGSRESIAGVGPEADGRLAREATCCDTCFDTGGCSPGSKLGLEFDEFVPKNIRI